MPQSFPTESALGAPVNVHYLALEFSGLRRHNNFSPYTTQTSGQPQGFIHPMKVVSIKETKLKRLPKFWSERSLVGSGLSYLGKRIHLDLSMSCLGVKMKKKYYSTWSKVAATLFSKL